MKKVLLLAILMAGISLAQYGGTFYPGNGGILPATVVQTSKGNKYTSGSQDFSLVPLIPNAGPTNPAPCEDGQMFFNTTSMSWQYCSSQNIWTPETTGGSVTNFSAGTLPPLFTTSVSTSTTTPALSFVLSNAAANTVFGRPAGTTGVPSFYTPVFTAGSGIGITGTFGDTGLTITNLSPMTFPAAGIAVSNGLGWTTSKASPSGEIVGTTDTQTLTNKTVDGVSPATFGFIDPTSSIQTQLNSKAPTDSPTFTGTVTFPLKTGNGAVVLATSPTLVTPTLGDASATTINGTSIPSSATLTSTVASGTAVLGTSAIASAACAPVVTVSATGVATTDVISFTPNADISAVTGYAVSTAGGLAIYPYPTSGHVNFKVCNPTGSSITPNAVTINWRVTR